MYPEEIQQIKKSGLFKESFHQDLIFIVSMVAVAAVAFSTARSNGNYRYFDSSNWIAVAIDVFFAALINLCVFGIGPAMFRRSRTRKKGGDLFNETLPISSYLGMAFVLAFAAAGLGISTPNDEFSGVSVGATQTECQPKGADELCLELTYEGNKKVSYFATWNYSSERVILGAYISKITWETKIDCSDETGMVTELSAFNGFGQSVEIGEARTEMISGINESEVPGLINAACNQ